MLSDNGSTEAQATRSGNAGMLLDPLFGFIVWAVHFLVIYCANGLACARGIGASGAALQVTFKSLLIAVTILALVVVVAHAVIRWRRRDAAYPFLSDIAVGNSAIAAVGIAMQMYPLLMLHLCR